MKKTEPTFEQAMERLDEIVSQMEKGTAPLADSLALFEEGTALIRRCETLLSDAEQKVVALRKGADGSPEEETFEYAL